MPLRDFLKEECNTFLDYFRAMGTFIVYAGSLMAIVVVILILGYWGVAKGFAYVSHKAQSILPGVDGVWVQDRGVEKENVEVIHFRSDHRWAALNGLVGGFSGGTWEQSGDLIYCLSGDDRSLTNLIFRLVGNELCLESERMGARMHHWEGYQVYRKREAED
tara:strand:- start:94 stop:579 length:486 start_codon:yes stop_codon:yes gene_type:complete